jgi:DNA-binding IclR family transcriptional regulator
MTLRTVERAINVLYHVCESDYPMSLTEVSKALELDKATTLRLLSTLVSGDLLKQDAQTRSYYIGPGILRLSRFWRHDLRSICRPHLESLLDQVDETICLIEPRGLDRICIDVLEPKKELRVVAELGRVQPIYSGASGRVLLAALPEQEMLAILDQVDLLQLTPQSVTDRTQYLNEIGLARKQGYAYAIDQVIVGSAGVSAPIVDANGAIVAAVVVRGPAARITKDISKEIGAAVCQVAKDIEGHLHE